MEGLSILIPTYNYGCTALVRQLLEQASRISVPFEIIVAEDGSDDETSVRQNQTINSLEHCRLLHREQNTGRASIRNFLASQAAYSRLLFIDSDMMVRRSDFLDKYLHTNAPVVDGGIEVNGALPGNLRYNYEKAAEHQHTAEKRLQQPYLDFHTANFMISRELMLRHPFDVRYRYYGYEDVAFGKSLKEGGISILHIDNPLSFEVFETNDQFLQKTEEGLRTLYQFREELADYSRLLQHVESLPHPLLSLLRILYRCFGKSIRSQLAGTHPSLFLFKIYKLGYYLNYKHIVYGKFITFVPKN